MTDHITAVAYETAVKQLANTQIIMSPHRHRHRHHLKGKVCLRNALSR